MKINKKNKNKSIILITISAILLVGVTFAFFTMRDKKSTESDYDQPISELKKTTTEDRTEPSDNKSKTYVPNTDKPLPPAIDDVSGKKKLQLISSHDISSGSLYIRGGINNASVRDGLCAAILSGPEDNSLRVETSLLQNASTTDCKTISIDMSKLVKGTWNYKLTYSSDNAEGESNGGSFEVQ